MSDLRAILSADDPHKALQDRISFLAERLDHAAAVGLFESFITRFPVVDPWVHFQLIHCYRALNQHGASFIVACAVKDADRDIGAAHVADAILQRLQSSGATEAATDVFRSHLLSFGDTIWSADAANYADRLGIVGAPHHAGAGRVDMRVTAGTHWAPWSPLRVIGGELPSALGDLQARRPRHAISVALIPDGQLLVSRGNAVICDPDGRVIENLSASEASDLLHWRYAHAPERFETHEVDDAVLISDRWWVSNICHFLLDHLPRLHLYARAGIDTATALVVGPELTAPFQHEMLKAAGVTRYVEVTTSASIRAKRLFVSTDCRNLQISANFGAEWSQAYLRKLLGRPRLRARRLLISRRDSGRRRIVNEMELMAILEPFGFEMVSLGEHSLEEQIQAFADATHVIGPHGAGMALLVFCGPGTEFAEVFHEAYSNGQIAMQARNRDVRYTAMLGHIAGPEGTATANPHYADMTLQPAVVEEWLIACGLNPL